MSELVAQDMGNLFNNELFSDLTLMVKGKRYSVHKCILAGRNEYFRTLLTTDFRESNQKEIVINESNGQLFEKLLRYIYSGENCVPKANVEVTIKMLIMANKYLVSEVQRSAEEQLREKLSMTTFCSIYSTAFACSAESLTKYCLQWVDGVPSQVLTLSGFSTLRVDAIQEIINRDSFKVSQVELFIAISKWIAANRGKVDEASVLLTKVGLSEMPVDFLKTKVFESGLFSERRISNVIAKKQRSLRALKGIKKTSMSTFWVNVQRQWRLEKGELSSELVTIGGLRSSDRVSLLKHRLCPGDNFNKNTTPKAFFSGALVLFVESAQYGIPLPDGYTLESYGIDSNSDLFYDGLMIDLPPGFEGIRVLGQS